MPRVRDALVNFAGASVTNGSIQKYLIDALNVAQLPGEFGVKPAVVDPLNDTVVDPTKWAIKGVSVTEGAYLGRNCLLLDGPPTTLGYDTDGVVYMPAIVGTVGEIWHCKLIMTDAIDWLVGLQEYAFTVNNLITPTNWFLKYLTAQVPDNSTYIRFSPGRIQIVRGGSAGPVVNVANSAWLASHPTDTTKQYPIHVAFIFTLTGFQIWVHQPGVWAEARLIHTEVRSTGTKPPNGYSFCVNKYSTDSRLGVFDPSTGFRNDCVVSGAVIDTALIQDEVQLNTLLMDYETGGVIGQNGSIAVRFPTLSPRSYSPAQIPELIDVLSGAHQHPVEFLLSGDIVLRHPTRINIVDYGLEAVATPTP